MTSGAFTSDPANTAAFVALNSTASACVAENADARPLRAVVVGGGTGAPVSIRTLLSLGVETSAVVAMADDGGSTGILREEADVTPPGDVRKCIAAFARDANDPLTRAFKYRFQVARNHTLGNLMLAALEDACGSFPEAIAVCERLLDVRGHTYPSTLQHVTLAARTRDGAVLEGQAVACRAGTALELVRLQADEPIAAYPPALEAIAAADLIVLGPGSLFTSVIPNLLVPGVADAIRNSRAKVLFVCGVADVQGETWGLTASEHVEALAAHGLRGAIDYVLLHSDKPVHPEPAVVDRYMEAHADEEVAAAAAPAAAEATAVRRVPLGYTDVLSIQAAGALPIVRNLADADRPTWHNPRALREAFAGVLKLCRSPRM